MLKNLFEISALLLTMLITSCGVVQIQTDSTQSSTPAPIAPVADQCPSQLPEISLLPEYIDGISPKGSILRADYLKYSDDPFTSPVIKIIIWADHIDSTVVSSRDTTYRIEQMQQRIELYVNDIQISSPNYIGDGLVDAGPFYFHWVPNLANGLHIATVKIKTDKGEILSYSWQFCMTD